MVKESWLMTYDPLQRPTFFDQVILSREMANKASELADYSMCTVWVRNNPHVFLLEVLRKKLNYPELKQATHELRSRWSPSKILIEDEAMRMSAETGFLKRGLVHLPSQAPWQEDFECGCVSARLVFTQI